MPSQPTSVANLQHSDARRPTVLTIAGSDSSGGAGIQADLRAIWSHGLHGASAITALTAQNTQGVSAVLPCPPPVLRAQIDAVFADLRVVAVKIGMLASAEIIDCVAAALRAHRPRRVVLDPVMVATSGARLLDDDALHALVEQLLPLATVITPNLPEASALLGGQPIDRGSMRAAAAALRELGASAVLLKGGHLQDDRICDLLDCAHGQFEFLTPKLPIEAHGTGCTLASALASRLALGDDLVEGCRTACAFVQTGLRNRYRVGLSDLVVLGCVGPGA